MAPGLAAARPKTRVWAPDLSGRPSRPAPGPFSAPIRIGPRLCLRRTRVWSPHPDKLGSTRALSKDDGTVAATYDYDAYGNLTAQTGFVQPFQFAGQYTDAESGLQYLRARYYDPATEQFISRDPLTPLTRAPYTYSADSPANRADPSGLDLGLTAADGGGGVPIGPAVDETAAQAIGGAIAGAVAAGIGAGVAVCSRLFAKGDNGKNGNGTKQSTSPDGDADKIAHGHAWADHEGDWQDIGIGDENALAQHLKEVMRNPKESKTLRDGRKIYRGEDGTIVIRDPNHPDGGTAFRPMDDPKGYYDRQN